MERSEEEFEELKELPAIVEEGDDFEREESAKSVSRENMEIESWNIFRRVGKTFKSDLVEGRELNMNLVVDLLVSKIKL